jgi:mgtE-like transporter
VPDRRRNLVRVPGPLLALGRSFACRSARSVTTGTQESRSIRSGSKALALGLGATLIAGITLASAEDRLESIPGLLALIPAAIGMRGAIFGALGSRLATGILTGQFDRQLTRRSYLGARSKPPASSASRRRPRPA